MNQPIVSIITVVYNGENTIEKTIQSVLKQTYTNIEYIIIDGASTDKTVSIIKKYEDKISYWISEPDAGIYEAMNKGLARANGEYISILNADDMYQPFAVQKSINNLIKNSSDYNVAKVQFLSKKNIISPIFPLEKNNIYQDMPYPHITAFISKRVYQEIGPFSTVYEIASDHDMALRIILKGYKASYLDEVIGVLTEGGVSDSLNATKESRDIAISHGKNFIIAYKDYYIYILKFYIVKYFPSPLVNFILRLKKSRFQLAL